MVTIWILFDVSRFNTAWKANGQKANLIICLHAWYQKKNKSNHFKCLLYVNIVLCSVLWFTSWHINKCVIAVLLVFVFVLINVVLFVLLQFLQFMLVNCLASQAHVIATDCYNHTAVNYTIGNTCLMITQNLSDWVIVLEGWHDKLQYYFCVLDF